MAGRLTEQLREATRAQSQLRPVDAEESAHADAQAQRRHGPLGWVSLLLVAALFIGGWLIMRQLRANSKIQDCVMSGRRNCAPIDTDSTPSSPTP